MSTLKHEVNELNFSMWTTFSSKPLQPFVLPQLSPDYSSFSTLTAQESVSIASTLAHTFE